MGSGSENLADLAQAKITKILQIASGFGWNKGLIGLCFCLQPALARDRECVRPMLHFEARLPCNQGAAWASFRPGIRVLRKWGNGESNGKRRGDWEIRVLYSGCYLGVVIC